ncbi:cyclase family protein [bacterium LRH843]|nr:cyclase family protein [bacterium LRH843]
MSIETLINAFKDVQVIDLSHTLEEQIPAWPAHASYSHMVVETYKKGDQACHYELKMSEHTGTHIDSPLHFIDGGKSIANIPISTFSGRAKTIHATTINPLGLLTQEEIVKWEGQNGGIEEDDIVLINFGWSKLWERKPNDEKFLTDWPGISKDAAEYFVSKKVKIVGTDALAIDVFGSTENPAHFELLGNDVLIMENLANLDLLPIESYFFGYPLKIKNGSGSPIRAVAFINK